jgi:hypothetical protein
MAFFSETREIELKWKYGLCIGLSLLGTVPAAIGFYLVIGETPIHPKQDYSQILGILSLLAAGTITGFFTFSYQNVRKDEVALPTFLSVSFATMFYLIFSGICLYMGKSESIHNVEAAAQYVPAIMWLLLLANVMYDFLDYRTNEESKPPAK